MKALTTMAATALLLLTATSTEAADGEFDVSGQVRLRIEFAKKSFDTGAVWDQFSEMRTRVAIETSVADNAHAYIQFQDSRVAGADDQSGALTNNMNVDIHQAYIKIDNLFGEGWGAKAGRFEFNLGNQRLFGAVGWSNIGRSWEGMQFWYDQPKFKVTPFWLKKAELRGTDYNRDFDLFGAVVDVKELNWQTFVALEKNADSMFAVDKSTSVKMDNKALSRLTLATHYKRKHNQFDFELNAALQTGDQSRARFDSTDGGGTDFYTTITEDISATMFAFEAGYTFNPEKGCRVAAGIDYTSGDDGKDGTKYKAFNNLYYTGHKFRGYMDYFVASNREGLMDLMLRSRISPMDGWHVNTDLHLISTAQDYIDPTDTTGATTTKDVGMEIDLVVSTTRVAGVKLFAGASYFSAKDAFAESTKNDPGLWLWGMTVFNF